MPSSRPIARAARSGFTLVEVLIGLFVGGVSLAMASQLLVGHINGVNLSVAASEAQRSFNRLNYLMSNELAEGCTMRLTTNPPTTAPCTPPTSACDDTTTASQLRVLVPVLNDAGQLDYDNIVRYYRSTFTNQLLRDGPRILRNGRLSPGAGNRQNAAVVIDGVTAFTARLSPDCRSATITLTLRPPNTTATFVRTFTLRNKVRESLS
jgi:prepilin-type N-terminal cleavage/methylation domain-containing protein